MKLNIHDKKLIINKLDDILFLFVMYKKYILYFYNPIYNCNFR
ncbi:MAG: hypothetical protein ACI8P3_000429 [Saprospiraceae bacterium]|jgi:hypothetical protein